MTKEAANHHKQAAEHHENAARHHREAGKHHEAGDHEAAAHHAHTAQGHTQHATHHAGEAAKLHTEHHGKKTKPAGKWRLTPKVQRSEPLAPAARYSSDSLSRILSPT